MAAALGGLDALVFTGGVGEHAPAVRAARGRRASAFLGVALDADAQRARRRPTPTSARRTRAARTLVVTAREDLEIARGVRAVSSYVSWRAPMRRVCVYCGSSPGRDPAYRDAAIALVGELARARARASSTAARTSA